MIGHIQFPSFSPLTIKRKKKKKKIGDPHPKERRVFFKFRQNEVLRRAEYSMNDDKGKKMDLFCLYVKQ